MPRTLFYHGRIHTIASRLVVDSMAVDGARIVAVGNRLNHDPDFKSYSRIDLKGRTVTPGFVDAHTHFYQLAQTKSQVSLDGLDSLDQCLRRIKKFAAGLPRRRWVVGTGLFPDGFRKWVEPNRLQLDKVTDGRPAFIFYKDTHSAWVNSRALEIAGFTRASPDPDGGRIERLDDGTPSGILREMSAYLDLYRQIPSLPKREMVACYRQTVDDAYRQGVTGVHSFDGPRGFEFLVGMEEKGKLGLRINYYPPASMLDRLEKTGTGYGAGTEFFRIAGVKLFSDGALGSQTAFCFNKYIGSRDNYGIEVTGVKEMTRIIRRAARLGLPSAVHAIGDRAVANVLEALEKANTGTLRHRIEHFQLARRKELLRAKKLKVVASMQPSHCPADIGLVRSYWGARSRNAYMFRTMLNRRIPLAFGSDAPIEPLDPLTGVAAAVRRARPGSRDLFHPEQRLYATEALEAFTAGSAYAAGQENERGVLLPGYPADFILMANDPTRVAPSRISGISVLATVLAGTVRYAHTSLKW